MSALAADEPAPAGRLLIVATDVQTAIRHARRSGLKRGEWAPVVRTHELVGVKHPDRLVLIRWRLRPALVELVERLATTGVAVYRHDKP